MKVSSYAVARPAYYDRNATRTAARYAADLGPNSFVVRWTATIAAGKKGFCENAFVLFRTVTLPTAVSWSDVYIYSSDGVTSLTLANIGIYGSTTVYQTIQDKSTVQLTLYAGATLNGATNNQNTGGTATNVVEAQITTFDA